MMRDVKIEAVLNGWIVTVGCQRLVFNGKEAMLENLSRYLDNPDKVEKYWREHGVNAKYTFVAEEAIADEPDTRGSIVVSNTGEGVHWTPPR